MLRIAYGSDETFRYSLPSSPAARLGTACHRVLEVAGGGGLPPREDPGWRDAFETAWTEAIGDEDERRQRNPLERHWPSPERWPYYAVRKTATRRLCQRLQSPQGRDRSTGEASTRTPRKNATEESQQAAGGRLRGRVDVVRRAPVAEIEDYKTGSLIDEASGDLRPSYSTQMNLYAVLEHATTGVWPLRATLVPLEGPSAVIEIDPVQATHMAEAALRNLDEYNDLVEQGVEPMALGAPAPSACKFCPYAIECPAFWTAADASWSEDGIVAIAGPIEGQEQSEHSTFNLTLEKVTGTIGADTCLLYQLDAERFGAVLGLPDGSEVAALWLTGDAENGELRATLRTRIAVAPVSVQ